MHRSHASQRQVTVVMLCAAVLTVLAVGPAQAQRVRWHDAVGDMWLTNDTAMKPTPLARVGDIRRVTVHYGTKALRLRVKFVDLRRTGDSLGIKGEIRTKRRGDWVTWVFWVGG